MKALRAIVVIAVLIGAGFLIARLVYHPSAPTGDHLTVFYTKLDGQSLGSWDVSLGKARDPKSLAFYASAQVLAGPPTSIEAIRFPAGTVVRRADVSGSTATVDLSGAVKATGGGSFTEAGEFKALVWTLTGLPGISSVRVLVDGARIATLPGGHLELDQPLSRQSW